MDTVRKNVKKIQEYIQNQLKEDWEYDQMTLKEYIDPFYGRAGKTKEIRKSPRGSSGELMLRLANFSMSL